MHKHLYQGEAIKELLPQREPILMVDTLYECDEQNCRTGLLIEEGNMFCVENIFSAEVIIEHIAQSASVQLGYKSKSKGEAVQTGYIGEVRNFELLLKPQVGDNLVTSISVISEVMGVTLIAAETVCNGKPVALCRMKISI